MGQSVSRHLPSRSPQPVREDNTPPEPGSGSRPSPAGSRTASATSKRSRRSSFRRSLLGLVPRSDSSTSVRSSTPPSSAESSQSPKKRWRSSFARRSSKAPIPPQLTELRQDEPHTEAAVEVGSSQTEEHAPGTHTHPPIPDIVISGEPPPEAETVAAAEELQDVDEDVKEWLGEQEEQGIPSDAVPRADGDATLEPTSPSEMHVDDATIPIAASPPPASTEPNPDSPPEAEAPPQAPRQFPPPGTLVVVQGVVNTTDVPSSDRAASSSRRPSRSTTPRPSGLQAVAGQRQGDSTSVSAARDGERHGTRNRLSSFINRSRLSPDSRSAEPPSSNRSSAVSSDLSSSIAGQDTVSAEESSIADDHDSDHDDGDAHPRPLSQGSIDVLGTLLSVAAAATAASLFSPGFAFPGANNSGNSSDAVRPMSPTPTAGLGNLAGLGALAGLGMDPSGASVGQGQGASQPRDGRDRIRNVWESVRDRLGLQPRGQSDGNASAEGDNPNEIRMRPGDMFAEMARALNIGLGLGDGNVPGTRQSDSNDGDDVPATEEGADTADAAAGDHAERPPPPEDSFERFLLNLQADLRAALSDDGAGHGESRRERNSVLSSVPSTFASSEDQQPVAGPSNPRPSADSAQMAEAAAQTSDSCAEGEDDLPPLQDVSDSDSDSDNEGDDDDDDASHDNHAERSDAPRSPRTPTPIPTGPFPFGPDTRHAGDGERRPPGVNLWRLYRFAPIPASHTAGHAAGTSAVPTNPPADAHATPSPGAPTSTTADEPDTAAPTHAEDVEDSATPSTAPATDPNANVVVPVIVVGLQSVDMNRNNDNAHTHGPDVQTQDDTRSSESDSRSLDEWRDSPTPGAGAGQSQSRGRTWQSRAASALRGLRPGRRTSRNRQNRDTGARTFLIYVIGGYYPPNHHMVTGSDSLDSYEALWELAELLGQVKPPVATREDIDNSGLQIIKSSELARYEEEGRVASNCVERCLICLEDYEPEDALRLMSCKHAYHQECVDRWLQVGRNNCPACRSKGVSTVGDSPSS